MEIREGYKKTEVGVIPQEWECVELGSISKYEGGSQPPLLTFSSTCKKGYIRLIQIRDYKTDKYATYIPVALAKRFCNENEIMIGRYGPPIFQILKGINGAYNVALMKAIPSKRITNEYLFYTLKRDDLFRYIELLSQRSSGQTGVDLVGLRSYLIALPPLPEQEVIANALSDIDGLISSLTKLINKKKNIKQGAMQEILTSKKRLDGFNGEWVEVKLEEVCEKIIDNRGKTPPLSDIGIPLLETNSIRSDFKHPNYALVTKYVSKTVYKTWFRDYLEKDDILISTVGMVGETSILNELCCAIAQNLIGLRILKNISAEFIYYFSKTSIFKSQVNAVLMGAVQPSLKVPHLLKFIIKLPPTLKEQIAIANILSDMDKEIETLQNKLVKYKAMKQGMMQKLLTGRIRLVEEVKE